MCESMSFIYYQKVVYRCWLTLKMKMCPIMQAEVSTSSIGHPYLFM